MRRHRTEGFALIVALGVIVVLSLVGTLLAAGTASELLESRSSLAAAQARAAAEAGATWGHVALRESGQDTLRDVLGLYGTPSPRGGGASADAWALPEDEWPAIAAAMERSLDRDAGRLPADALDAVAAAVDIDFEVDGLRGATREPELQTYVAEYRVVATGRAAESTRRIETRGSLHVAVGRVPLNTWLFLVEDGGGKVGYLPTGTVFDGPVHANRDWGFWGQPEFLDQVSTSVDYAYYWKADRTCPGAQRERLAADSRPPCTVPAFHKGFQRGVDRVELPKAAWSQQRAALGLDPRADRDRDGRPDPVDDRELCRALGDQPCRRGYRPSEGIHVVHDGSKVTGGIYVEGDLERLELAVGPGGEQVVTLVHEAETVVVTIDHAADRTVVASRDEDDGWRTLGLTGTPNGTAAAAGAGAPHVGANGQVYVSGEIRALGGPPRTGRLPDDPPAHPVPAEVPPAVALETQLSITAVDRIGIVADLVYECDPTRIDDAGYVAGRPRCDLLEVPTVLGVQSLQADLAIERAAPDDLYLWGAYLATGKDRGLVVADLRRRPAQGTLRLFGSLGQWTDGLRGLGYSDGSLRSGYLDAFEFDRRFSEGGVVPPTFPTAGTVDIHEVLAVPLTFREF